MRVCVRQMNGKGRVLELHPASNLGQLKVVLARFLSFFFMLFFFVCLPH